MAGESLLKYPDRVERNFKEDKVSIEFLYFPVRKKGIIYGGNRYAYGIEIQKTRKYYLVTIYEYSENWNGTGLKYRESIKIKDRDELSPFFDKEYSDEGLFSYFLQFLEKHAEELTNCGEYFRYVSNLCHYMVEKLRENTS